MIAILSRCFGLALLVVLLPLHLAGTRLASRVFTTADGLGRDGINCIVPDSKGFLWLCTSEGISRYDGYQFISYGVAQGLAHRAANAVLETRAGVYLVATDLGINRLDVSKPPTSAQRFVSIPRSDGIPVSRVYALNEDQAGVVWGATVGGLYRVEGLGGLDLISDSSAWVVVARKQQPHRWSTTHFKRHSVIAPSALFGHVFRGH